MFILYMNEPYQVRSLSYYIYLNVIISHGPCIQSFYSVAILWKKFINL